MKSFLGCMFGMIACLAIVSWAYSSGPKKQGFAAVKFIRLQGESPGINETGHGHISGTMIAGRFRGSALTVTGEDASGVVQATNSSNFGAAGSFESTGPNGVGVSGTGAYSGLSGESANIGVHGSGAVGISGRTEDATGRGVYGYALGGISENYGGYFSSTSLNGIGAYASGNTGVEIVGQKYGVNAVVEGSSISYVFGGRFESSNTSMGAYGVYGLASAIDATGVHGAVTSGALGVGVSGTASSGLFNWAVYANGDFGCSGTKSFVIDDPRDPENKMLKHYCTEGPEPQNAYNGVVTTDSRGYAWVQLPDYFQEINKDFRYQLTVIDDGDDFVLAKVTKEALDNRFQIRTSAPRVRVSWEVKARRNDPWVRKYGAPVELEKPAHRRGKYEHPELYGQPVEMGAHYIPERERSKQRARP